MLKFLVAIAVLLALQLHETYANVCYRDFRSHFGIQGVCAHPMGGQRRQMGVFIRSYRSCCRRKFAKAWGLPHACQSCAAIRGIVSAWNNWSPCSRSCGVGRQHRRRICSNNVCAGMRKKRVIQTRECTWSSCCPVDGQWSTWSESTGCTVSCGLGVEFRSRVCNSPEPTCGGRRCPGPPRQFMECFASNCHPPTWGEWAVNSPCSATCGEGTRSRFRECLHADFCEGASEDRVPCKEKPCPEMANWCPWSEWRPCSTTCGRDQGTKTRTRLCACPAPQPWGEPCAGTNSETAFCNAAEPCPVNGGFGNWTQWSQCSALPCSTNKGFQMKVRMCDNPTPAHSGLPCEGIFHMKRGCLNMEGCMVEGFYGPWSPWSQCSETCGKCGSRTRSRECRSPFTNPNEWNVDVIAGNPELLCNADRSRERQDCDLQRCPDGSNPCDVTVVPSFRHLSRHHDKGAALNGHRNKREDTTTKENNSNFETTDPSSVHKKAKSSTHKALVTQSDSTESEGINAVKNSYTTTVKTALTNNQETTSNQNQEITELISVGTKTTSESAVKKNKIPQVKPTEGIFIFENDLGEVGVDARKLRQKLESIKFNGNFGKILNGAHKKQTAKNLNSHPINGQINGGHKSVFETETLESTNEIAASSFKPNVGESHVPFSDKTVDGSTTTKPMTDTHTQISHTKPVRGLSLTEGRKANRKERVTSQFASYSFEPDEAETAPSTVSVTSQYKPNTNTAGEKATDAPETTDFPKQSPSYLDQVSLSRLVSTVSASSASQTKMFSTAQQRSSHTDVKQLTEQTEYGRPSSPIDLEVVSQSTEVDSHKPTKVTNKPRYRKKEHERTFGATDAARPRQAESVAPTSQLSEFEHKRIDTEELKTKHSPLNDATSLNHSYSNPQPTTPRPPTTGDKKLINSISNNILQEENLNTEVNTTFALKFTPGPHGKSIETLSDAKALTQTNRESSVETTPIQRKANIPTSFDLRQTVAHEKDIPTSQISDVTELDTENPGVKTHIREIRSIRPPPVKDFTQTIPTNLNHRTTVSNERNWYNTDQQFQNDKTTATSTDINTASPSSDSYNGFLTGHVQQTVSATDELTKEFAKGSPMPETRMDSDSSNTLQSNPLVSVHEFPKETSANSNTEPISKKSREVLTYTTMSAPKHKQHDETSFSKTEYRVPHSDTTLRSFAKVSSPETRTTPQPFEYVQQEKTSALPDTISRPFAKAPSQETDSPLQSFEQHKNVSTTFSKTESPVLHSDTTPRSIADVSSSGPRTTLESFDQKQRESTSTSFLNTEFTTTLSESTPRLFAKVSSLEKRPTSSLDHTLLEKTYTSVLETESRIPQSDTTSHSFDKVSSQEPRDSLHTFEHEQQETTSESSVSLPDATTRPFSKVSAQVTRSPLQSFDHKQYEKVSTSFSKTKSSRSHSETTPHSLYRVSLPDTGSTPSLEHTEYKKISTSYLDTESPLLQRVTTPRSFASATLPPDQDGQTTQGFAANLENIVEDKIPAFTSPFSHHEKFVSNVNEIHQTTHSDTQRLGVTNPQLSFQPAAFSPSSSDNANNHRMDLTSPYSEMAVSGRDDISTTVPYTSLTKDSDAYHSTDYEKREGSTFVESSVSSTEPVRGQIYETKHNQDYIGKAVIEPAALIERSKEDHNKLFVTYVSVITYEVDLEQYSDFKDNNRILLSNYTMKFVGDSLKQDNLNDQGVFAANSSGPNFELCRAENLVTTLATKPPDCQNGPWDFSHKVVEGRDPFTSTGSPQSVLDLPTYDTVPSMKEDEPVLQISPTSPDTNDQNEYDSSGMDLDYESGYGEDVNIGVTNGKIPDYSFLKDVINLSLKDSQGMKAPELAPSDRSEEIKFSTEQFFQDEFLLPMTEHKTPSQNKHASPLVKSNKVDVATDAKTVAATSKPPLQIMTDTNDYQYNGLNGDDHSRGFDLFGLDVNGREHRTIFHPTNNDDHSSIKESLMQNAKMEENSEGDSNKYYSPSGDNSPDYSSLYDEPDYLEDIDMADKTKTEEKFSICDDLSITPELKRCCKVVNDTYGQDDVSMTTCLSVLFKSEYGYDEDVDVEAGVSLRGSTRCVCRRNRAYMKTLCCHKQTCGRWRKPLFRSMCRVCQPFCKPCFQPLLSG